MYYCYRMMEIISTDSSVYARVWPCIWASYNHLLHNEYNWIQCISGVQVRYNITTYKLLHFFTLSKCSMLQLQLQRYKKFP